jgi:hypothetical protein
MKMNFKIENNYIHITNYPNIGKHFEEMAAKGWLINKIIASNIFIYKKIKPEALDFSISPYEVETEFTRKTKNELAEFQSVCESVGWNYALKSYNLHIYYKEKGSEALDIQTDEEEEFRTLEILGKRYVRGLYIQIPLFLFLAWSIMRQLFTGVDGMNDALPQLLSLMFPLTLLMLVVEAYNISRFLKKNRNNIEIGESIEYSKSNFYINKITFTATYISLFIFILFMLYGIMFLKNTFLLIGMIPISLTLLIVTFYSIFIKSSKMSTKSKKKSFVATLILSTIISIILFGFVFINGLNKLNDGDIPNIEGYKVISVNDFQNSTVEEDGELRRQASVVIPTSYSYYSHSNQIYERTKTEYSRALTEDLAKILVKRYVKLAEIQIDRDRKELEIYFRDNHYNEFLLGEDAGISLEEFNSLREGDLKEAVNITINKLKERAITKDSGSLWNVNEAYFLNYNKSEIVMRRGKEVFYIDAPEKDFTDPKIIKIVKDKLGLK